MTFGIMTGLGLLTFVAGAWLMRQQKLNARDDGAPASLPSPMDFGEYLLQIVAYACVGGGALLFLGSMAAAVYSIFG